jgi:hypothetical protein
MADDIYSLAEAYDGTRGLKAPAQTSPGSASGGNLEELLSMLKRPSTPREQSVYEPQLAEALVRRRGDEEAFNQMIKAAMERKEETGPGKAEMYFRLAAAFGSPTKTGNFFENLGKAGQAAGDIEKERRDAAYGERDKLLQLGMLKHKMALEGSKEEVGTLRQLTAQEMAERRAAATADAADKRAFALKQYEAFLASNKPQSEAGKYAADQGYKPGTPEFAKIAEKYMRDKMENGDWFKQLSAQIQMGNQAIAQQGLALRQDQAETQKRERAKLTPPELKIKNETETALNALRDSYSDIRKAQELNPNTYDSSLPDTLEYKVKSAAGSTDPRVVNTGELSNLLRQGALTTATTTLKTHISDADIKMLQGLQGLDAKSKKERETILKNAEARILENYKLKKQQLNQINSGQYRITTPELPDTLEQ